MEAIKGTDISDMVRHWLQTPVGGYLGSDYGSDIKALLFTPNAAVNADAVIDKLRKDVPILQMLPDGSVNIYAQQSAPDKLEFFIEVAGQVIQIKNN